MTKITFQQKNARRKAAREDKQYKEGRKLRRQFPNGAFGDKDRVSDANREIMAAGTFKNDQ